MKLTPAQLSKKEAYHENQRQEVSSPGNTLTIPFMPPVPFCWLLLSSAASA